MGDNDRNKPEDPGETEFLRAELTDCNPTDNEPSGAEKALRESEAKYRMIFEHSPLGILHFDEKGTITACNENFVAIIGSSKERLIGLNMLRDINDEPMIAAVAEALAGGVGRYEGEYRSVTAKKITPVKCSFSPLFGEDRSILGGIGIVEDISERKKAQDALAHQENVYRQVVEKARDIIYVTDVQGRFTLINPMALQITGYTRDELIGKPYVDLIVKKQRRKVGRFYRRQFVDRIPETYYEFPIRTKARNIAWLGQQVQLVFNEDKVIGFQAIARDITDRKKSEEALRQSEERYRSIIEQIEEGYYEVDLSGNMRFFNDSLCRILGYSSTELMGMNSRQFMDEANAKRIFEIFNRIYLTGKPSGMFSWEFRTSDGSIRNIEASGSLVRDAQAKPSGFRGICRDVTERKRAEALLLRSERLNAIGELATGVAHNFNNLLQILTGLGDLIALQVRRNNIPALEAHVKHLLNICRIGAETVQRLQDFARIRSSAVPSEQKVFDLSETIKQALAVTEVWWKTVPEKQGISISMRTDLASGCWVNGRENELFEVAINLIKNAVEALPRGGEIGVTLSGENEQAVFRVFDNGTGISQQNVGKIFQPFFTTKGFQSSGMGLASSYGIVSQHNGEIGVETVPGKGTTFTVRLPSAICQTLPEVTSCEAPVKVGADILLIDDIEDVVVMLGEALTELGLHVMTARSGSEGLQVFSEHAVDLVICDLGMPGMNGWEVAAGIKAFCSEKCVRKPPFVLLTGWGGQQSEVEAIHRSGVDAVVEKPINIMKLFHLIRTMVPAEAHQ